MLQRCNPLALNEPVIDFCNAVEAACVNLRKKLGKLDGEAEVHLESPNTNKTHTYSPQQKTILNFTKHKGGYYPGCQKASVDLWTVEDKETKTKYWRCGICKRSGKLDAVSLMKFNEKLKREKITAFLEAS
jgi:hypothetical protein